MDGPFLVAVQFKGNTKNCFISVPNSWVQNYRHNDVVAFEIKSQNNANLYFSWSGDTSPSNDSIVINGFFALKQGLKEGEMVTVVRKRDIPSIETVEVEPITVDDWEILELHADYIQNNILNQVRVIWSNQILPIWVNQMVCIFLRLKKLEPSCSVGLLINSTELHITPKDRKSRSIIDEPQLPLVNSQISRVDEQISTPETLENSPGEPESTWSFSDKLKRTIQAWYSVDASGKKSSSDEVKENVKAELLKTDRSNDVEVRLRVHPININLISEYFSNEKVDCQNSENIKSLLTQPTNVLVTTANCNVNRSKVKNPIMLGKLTNVIDTTESIKPKTESQQTLTKEEKHCHVKIVFLDILLDYAKNDKSLKSLLTQLINEQCNGAVLVHQTVRRFIRCQVTTYVQLKIRNRIATSTPAKILLLPLDEITVEIKDEHTLEEQEKERNDQINLWMVSNCSLSCPLLLFNKFIVTIPIKGIESAFLVQPTESVKDGVRNSVCMVTPATSIQPQWNVIIKDDFYDLTFPTDWNATTIGSPSITLGGVNSLIDDSKTYINMILNLGTLAHHCRSAALNCTVEGGILLCGSSGEGKSSITRALARDFSEPPHYVYSDYIRCKALKGKRAESILKIWKNAFDKAFSRQPSIVILDDLDELVGFATGPENEIGAAANYREKLSIGLKQLMKSCFISNANVLTIVTANSVSNLPQTLISSQGTHLFQKIVKIPSLNLDQRLDIFKRVILSKPLIASDVIDSKSIDWESLAIKMHGYVARDLNTIVDRAILQACIRNKDCPSDSEVSVTQGDLEKAMIDYVPIALRCLNIHTPGDKCWEDVGGLQQVKQTLVETLQWPTKYPKLFENCPLAMRSGILIYGPPGTGKTLLASVVAKECNMNFISIKGPELLSKYIGASEQAVRNLFERATKAQPCIIFFDEFDSLAPRRGHDSTGVTDRVVNQLLTQMDGVEGRKGVYVLAATSRPDLIDPALLRPGRLDKCLFCHLPTTEEREQILIALSRNMSMSDDVDLSFIAELCQDLSGADLQGLLYNAQMDAIHRTLGQLYVMDKSLVEMDYVICKKDEAAATSSSESCAENKEHDFQMIHFRNLEDGPEEGDSEIWKAQKQKMTCILSNVEKAMGGKSRTLNEDDDDNNNANKHPPVVVNQSNLLEAVKQMKPSVKPEDRRRYELIYEMFNKTRIGHFETSSESTLQLNGNRATLA